MNWSLIMQKIKCGRSYGSITFTEPQDEPSRRSETPSSTPLTPAERVEAVSTAGSEYYISLSSVSSCNSSEGVVCFRIDESGSTFIKSSHKFNHHGENCVETPHKTSTTGLTATTIRAIVRNSCDSFLHYLGFNKNPVLPTSTSESSLASTANISSYTREDSLDNDASPLMYQYQKNAALTSKCKAQLSRRNSSYADVRLSMVSNFSAAYNTTNVSLALTLMKSLYPPNNASDVYICSSALIAGMIIGQLGGGLLGDWLGRHAAMAVVMSLQVAAAFGSGWVGWIGFSGRINIDIYSSLAVWRLLLGVGCGGVYPLAASIAAESSSAKEDRGKLVALTFSMQGVGYLAVSLVALILVRLLGEESDMAWRLLLGLGCIPGLALICFRVHRRRIESSESSNTQHSNNITISKGNDDGKDEQEAEKTGSTVRLPPTSLLQQIRNEPDLLRKIIGTAGCWLLFDILFYGNTLFQPVVLSAAFGTSETVLATIRDSTLISLMALPGYFVSVLMVGKHQTPKAIQLQGFLVMGVLYTLIGVYFSSLARHRILLLALYGMTFFFSNYGPNSTTFMMPSMTFSRPCRSTLNGVCAASGKIGALIGASLFVPLANWLGNDRMMIICATVSIVAATMTTVLSSAIEDKMEVPDDHKKVPTVSSEAHLLALMQKPAQKIYMDSAELEASGSPCDLSPSLTFNRVGSMPTFLDSQ